MDSGAQENRNDLISRREAIDEFVKWGKIQDYDDDERTVIACAIGMLSCMPSAQPEIIHCKDCMFRKTHGVSLCCDHITGDEIMVKPSDFCSWAERDRMTVRDNCKCSLSEILITTKDFSSTEQPEIMVCSHSDAEEEEFLSEKVLNSEVYLMEARDDCIFICLRKMLRILIAFILGGTLGFFLTALFTAGGDR